MIHLCPLALYPAQGWTPFRHSRRLRRFGLQVSGEHVDHVPLFEVLFLLQPCRRPQRRSAYTKIYVLKRFTNVPKRFTIVRWSAYNAQRTAYSVQHLAVVAALQGPDCTSSHRSATRLERVGAGQTGPVPKPEA